MSEGEDLSDDKPFAERVKELAAARVAAEKKKAQSAVAAKVLMGPLGGMASAAAAAAEKAKGKVGRESHEQAALLAAMQSYTPASLADDWMGPVPSFQAMNSVRVVRFLSGSSPSERRDLYLTKAIGKAAPAGPYGVRGLSLGAITLRGTDVRSTRLGVAPMELGEPGRPVQAAISKMIPDSEEAV